MYRVLGGRGRRSRTALGRGALDRRWCPSTGRPSAPGAAAPEGLTWVRPWLTGSASGVEDRPHDSLSVRSCFLRGLQVHYV